MTTVSPDAREAWWKMREKKLVGIAERNKAEVSRLREVIKVGGAMYRAERVTLGVPVTELVKIERSIESIAEEVAKYAAMGASENDIRVRLQRLLSEAKPVR